MRLFPSKLLLLSTLAIQPLSSIQAEEPSRCAHAKWILNHLDTIPDFPIPGVQFKSITPLLKDPAAFQKVIQLFADQYRDAEIDGIAGLESRGFVFGAALAYELQLPFILIRKSGKLPGDVLSVKYDLEYGKACFEIEKKAISRGQKILLIDDVLATGGTAKAAGELIEGLGGEVHEFACLIEIPFLKGRGKIPYPVFSMLSID